MKNEDCKKLVIQMLNYLDESDTAFLRQIYTLIKKHLERKRGR